MPKPNHPFNNKQTIVLEDDDILRGAKLTEDTGLALSDVNRACLRFGLDHFGKKPLDLVTYRAKRKMRTRAKKKAKK